MRHLNRRARLHTTSAVCNCHTNLKITLPFPDRCTRQTRRTSRALPCQRKHRRGRLLRDRPPLGTRLLIPPLPLVGALRDAIALGGQTICVCVMMQTTPDARRDRIRFFYWGKHRTDLVAGMGVGNVVSNLDYCDSSRRSGIYFLKLYASTLLASH